MVVNNPYTEYTHDHLVVYRTFSCSVDELELVWHRDRENRFVTVIEGEGWQYQEENKLPIKLTPGDKIFIPRYTYHRIIKGSTDLKIRIQKDFT